jgi:mannose-6-phosphate isomerase-like protein (cupin superfamily)
METEIEYPGEKRPWGEFYNLYEAVGVKVKRLIVSPKNRLSLQSHQKRDEHWVVVKGVATVTCGESTFTLNEGQSVDIYIGVKHRLANRGTENLEIIEVQRGNYLGEDDIVRYDDDFKR